MSQLKHIVIKTIYYFNDNGEFVSENFKFMNRCHISRGFQLINQKNSKGYVQCCR